jgi:hypothetical protein
VPKAVLSGVPCALSNEENRRALMRWNVGFEASPSRIKAPVAVRISRAKTAWYEARSLLMLTPDMTGSELCSSQVELPQSHTKSLP